MTDAWLIDSDLDRYIPMMISRMIISLKKVTSSRKTYMGMEIPASLAMSPQDSYAPHLVESIQLSPVGP